MCGILGWVGFGGEVPALDLRRLNHRGPDDHGFEFFKSHSGRVRAALGSTRLSIIDLSSAGHMPMIHPRDPIAIVYNGEVYNFKELRAELQKAGEEFLSGTDTEVVLNGYRVWGEKIVDHLRGMFAFGIWDGRGSGRLILGRDRFGKKPLYFKVKHGEEILFSSELKALLSQGSAREIDPEALEYYLDRGYPPSDRCLLQGYRKLPPGHILSWENGKVQEKRYWDLPQPDPEFAALSSDEAASQLRGRLREAVKLRMVADVPVGALLSGGIDSSSIVTLMAELSPGMLRTYTAAFGSAMLDESEKARQTALRIGSRHCSIMINPRSGRVLPFIASQMDEPIADPSAIATYFICRRARQEVTVVLTGDGSDELLLGYPRYRLHAASEILNHFPVCLRRMGSRIFPPWSIPERTLSAPGDPLLRDRYWLAHRRERKNAFRRPSSPLPPSEAVRAVLREDIQTWLVDEVLMKLDKMSMAASVEARAPFLDSQLADWIFALPVWAKMSVFQGKTILREAMKDLLPPTVSMRRKQAFLLPIDEWLRSEWKILIQDVLLDPRTGHRDWVDKREISRILHQHLAGQAFHGRRLYQLLILELWARSILDRGESEPLPAGVDDCVRDLPSDRPFRKIAILAPAGIGDTMRLAPAIAQLGESDPAISVTLYVDRDRGSDQVMAGMSPVDRHVPIDFAHKGPGKALKLLQDLRWNPPDQLISAWISKLAGLTGFLSQVHQRTGWAPQWSLGMRLASLFWKEKITFEPVRTNIGPHDTLSFSKMLGITHQKRIAPLFAPPIWERKELKEAKEKVRALPSPILAISAAAAPTIRQREYPFSKMEQVLKGLVESGIVNSIVLIGDEASRARLRSLSRDLNSHCLNLSGELSMTGTGAVMRECDAALVIDGGLLHLALSTDLPVVVIYGPTVVYSSDPRREKNKFRSLSAFGSCRCHYLNHRGIKIERECQKEAQCLHEISPEQVIQAVAEILHAQPERNRPNSFPRPVLEARNLNCCV